MVKCTLVQAVRLCISRMTMALEGGEGSVSHPSYSKKDRPLKVVPLQLRSAFLDTLVQWSPPEKIPGASIRITASPL